MDGLQKTSALHKNQPYETNEKHNTHGTGSGLYLMKRIIQNLGGNIRYEAKKHGSAFVLTLPIEAQ